MTGATGTRSLPRRVAASPFVRVVGQSFAVRLIGSAVSLLLVIVVARALGPQGRGAYAVAAAAATMGVQFGSLGLNTANTYFAARDRSLDGALFANTLLAGTVSAVVTAGAAILVVGIVAPIALVHGGTLVVTAAWVGAGLVFLLLQSLALGLGDLSAYNLAEVISKGVLVLGAVVVVASRLSSVVLFVAASVLGVLAGIGWLLRSLHRDGVRPSGVSTPLLLTCLGYGLRTYIASFLSFALLRADTFMVQRYLGAVQTGFYSVAVSIADVLFILPALVGTLGLARMSAASSNEERLSQARRIAVGLGLVMAVAAAVTALVAAPLIRVLFGQAFDPSTRALLWLLPGVVLLSVNVVLNNHFAASGMPWAIVLAPGVVVALNIALNTIVIPAYGIAGAAWMSSLCYGLQLMVSCAFLIWTRPKVAIRT